MPALVVVRLDRSVIGGRDAIGTLGSSVVEDAADASATDALLSAVAQVSLDLPGRECLPRRRRRP